MTIAEVPPRERVPPGYECKRCGDARPPDNVCSWCGGHGMVTGAYGDPTECRHCGYSGVEWPPRCEGCTAFRRPLPLQEDSPA